MKILRLIFLIIAFSSSVTYAEIATDTQTLTLTVPLVALIDVEDISPSFTFDAPTNAGDGFSGDLSASNNMPTVAISSNNTLAKLNVHISNDLSTSGITLQMMSSTLCGFVQKTLTTTEQKLCNIGTTKISNGGIIITANPSNGIGSMIPYGKYTTNIIYTLTQN